MKINMSIVILCLMSVLLFTEIGIEYENTTLSKIKESPTSFKNMGVKIKIIFNSVTDNWIPVFTFFSSEKYINFAGWGYEQHIWYKKGLINDYPYFYIRKDIDGAKKIIKANRYQCFELKGVVRNVYEGKAWIEVEEIKPSASPCIDEDTLSLAIKANESFREDDFIKVLYFAEKLRNKSLPSDLDIRIRDIKCFSYLQLNLRKDALRCYSNLFSITGKEKYKVIINKLKKHLKNDRTSINTMLYIKKLQQIIGEKNIQLENLKKEVETLKKIISNTISEKNFKTNGVKDEVSINNITVPKEATLNGIYFAGNTFNIVFECDNFVGLGRRTIEGRLDREEINAMLEKKDRCSKIYDKVYNKKHSWIRRFGKGMSADELTKYKKNINATIPKFSRRIIDRRLDREEFEYLLNKNKNQL